MAHCSGTAPLVTGCPNWLKCPRSGSEGASAGHPQAVDHSSELSTTLLGLQGRSLHLLPKPLGELPGGPSVKLAQVLLGAAAPKLSEFPVSFQ